MRNEIKLPEELDERLKAWGAYFRDRHVFGKCGSIESRFQAMSPGSWDEGWGNQSEIPPSPVQKPVDLRSVLTTHSAVMELGNVQKWSVTVGYCYPAMERWMALRTIRKYAGERLTWNRYLEQLDLGRLRIWARIGGC